MTTETDALTVREALDRMDEGWNDFGARMHAMPNEQLEERLGDGAWTRKQMLAHIATWHDLTGDRLARFIDTGEPPGLDEDEDAINARAARGATGRTTGEIVQGVDDSYRRLHRQVSRLTDAQLVDHDGFAAAIIAGNSYGHYREHLADLGGVVGRAPGGAG
jgi:hypothetical protein